MILGKAGITAAYDNIKSSQITCKSMKKYEQ